MTESPTSWALCAIEAICPIETLRVYNIPSERLKREIDSYALVYM